MDMIPSKTTQLFHQPNSLEEAGTKRSKEGSMKFSKEKIKGDEYFRSQNNFIDIPMRDNDQESFDKMVQE